MLSDLSKYRSSVLCDGRDGRTPPIGKLPVVDRPEYAVAGAKVREWRILVLCDCKVASKVECYDAPKFAKNNAARRFDCTPSWINEHKVIC